MLRLSSNVTFFAPAVVALNGFKSDPFKIEFKLVPLDELEAMQEQQKAGEMTPREFVTKLVVGWPMGEIEDQDGNALMYGAETLPRVLAWPGVPLAMIKAFYTGYEEATEGNSEPLPAG